MQCKRICGSFLTKTVKGLLYTKSTKGLVKMQKTRLGFPLSSGDRISENSIVLLQELH